MEVVVLANGAARWLRADGRVRQAVFAPRPGVRVVETRSLAELDAAADEIARAAPRVIVLAGGDGTHGASISALVAAHARAGRELPVVALAPAGTTCTVARNWSFRGGGVFTAGERTAARECARVVEAARAGGARHVVRPTIRVRGGDGERLAFIVGAGLVARFFEVYDARGAGGYRDALRVALRVFAGSFVDAPLARRVLTPEPCALEIDGEDTGLSRVSLFVASVVRDLGLSLRLSYRAGEDLTRVHVVASALGPRALGPQMPRVLAARPLVGGGVDALCSRARLVFPGGAGAYVVDGDLVRGDAFYVEAGPPVRVLALDR